MEDIFDSLVQAIDENSYPYLCPKAEYRQEQYRAEQHLQWLKEHLNNEEKAHLDQLLNAELQISVLENKALIKVALATGIRFALPR